MTKVLKESPFKITVTRPFTVTEIAAATKKCTKTIYREIRSGRLKALRIGGMYAVTQEQLDEYLSRPTPQAEARATALRILSA